MGLALIRVEQDFDGKQHHEQIAGISYSRFARVRARLAAAENIDLDRMEGYTTSLWRRAISWDSVNSSLRPLLEHSDCEGGFTAAECAVIAGRLAEIAGYWLRVDSTDPDAAFALRLAAAAADIGQWGGSIEFA